MSQPDRPVQINMSGIPVAGVGGLGLVAMAVLVSVFMPAAWWTMVFGLAGGCALAVALIVVRRRIDARAPSGRDRSLLFSEPAGAASTQENPARQGAKRLSLVPARQRA